MEDNKFSNKNQFIIYLVICVIVMSIFFTTYILFSKSAKENVNRINKSKIVYPSLRTKLDISDKEYNYHTYSDQNSLYISLSDGYDYAVLQNRYLEHEQIKVKIDNNTLNIDMDKLPKKQSIYKIILHKDNTYKTISSNEQNEIEIKNEFLLISDDDLYISTKNMNINANKESKKLVDYINKLRKSLGLKKLWTNQRINLLCNQRTLDEVNDKSQHYYYSSSTGAANQALYDKKIIGDFRVSNLNGNDFEQTSRGIIFAWNVFNFLKKSDSYYPKLTNSEVTTIGSGMSYDIEPKNLNLVNIELFGDHKDELSMYVNSDINQGFIDIKQQDTKEIQLYNVAYSIFIL